MKRTAGILMAGFLIGFLGQIPVANGETVGEQFERAIREIAQQCASRKLEPNEVCGEVAKLKPATHWRPKKAGSPTVSRFRILSLPTAATSPV